jgi:hypothetical protein
VIGRDLVERTGALLLASLLLQEELELMPQKIRELSWAVYPRLTIRDGLGAVGVLPARLPVHVVSFAM